MTPEQERSEAIKPYFNKEQLNELAREIKTSPTDEDGYVQPVGYSEQFVRGTMLKLIADIRNSLDREEQLIAGIENARSLRDFAVKKSNELIAENDQLKIEKGALKDEADIFHDWWKESLAKVAEQDEEIQHRKKYEGFLKSCIACGESLEKTGYDKFEYWLEKYLLTIRIPNEVEAEG